MSKFESVQVAYEEDNEKVYEGYLEYIDEMQDEISFEHYLNEVACPCCVIWRDVYA